MAQCPLQVEDYPNVLLVGPGGNRLPDLPVDSEGFMGDINTQSESSNETTRWIHD